MVYYLLYQWYTTYCINGILLTVSMVYYLLYQWYTTYCINGILLLCQWYTTYCINGILLTVSTLNSSWPPPREVSTTIFTKSPNLRKQGTQRNSVYSTTTSYFGWKVHKIIYSPCIHVDFLGLYRYTTLLFQFFYQPEEKVNISWWLVYVGFAKNYQLSRTCRAKNTWVPGFPTIAFGHWNS
jgi:hypothetical protein